MFNGGWKMVAGVRVVVYARARSATAVVYVRTLAGVRPVSVRLSRRKAEKLKMGARSVKSFEGGWSGRLSTVAAAKLILGSEAIRSRADPKWLDRIVRAAYRRDAQIRAAVWRAALGKVGGDRDLARAYLGAWLRARNREVPGGDADADLVSQQYYKLVWRLGDRYVVQVAPWE